MKTLGARPALQSGTGISEGCIARCAEFERESAPYSARRESDARGPLDAYHPGMRRLILIALLSVLGCGGAPAPADESTAESTSGSDDTREAEEPAAPAAEETEPVTSEPAPAEAAEATPPALDLAAATERIIADIAEVGERERTITREAFDLLLSDERIAMRSARIIPYTDNGRAVGFRVYGVRQHSIPAALGLLNGDLVRKINGQNVGTVDELARAYEALQGADEMLLDITRRGQDVTVRVRVLDPPS